MKLSSYDITGLMKKLDSELILIELGAYATFFGDPLDKADRERVLLAIRRFEALRGAISARLK